MNKFSCAIHCDGGCPNFVHCPYDNEQVPVKDKTASIRRSIEQTKYEAKKTAISKISKRIKDIPHKKQLSRSTEQEKYGKLCKRVAAKAKAEAETSKAKAKAEVAEVEAIKAKVRAEVAEAEATKLKAKVAKAEVSKMEAALAKSKAKAKAKAK